MSGHKCDDVSRRLATTTEALKVIQAMADELSQRVAWLEKTLGIKR